MLPQRTWGGGEVELSQDGLSWGCFTESNQLFDVVFPNQFCKGVVDAISISLLVEDEAGRCRAVLVSFRIRVYSRAWSDFDRFIWDPRRLHEKWRRLVLGEGCLLPSSCDV